VIIFAAVAAVIGLGVAAVHLLRRARFVVEILGVETARLTVMEAVKAWARFGFPVRRTTALPVRLRVRVRG